jgi:hypothetical protein
VSAGAKIMTTRQIFLSHSSTDGMLATLLAHEIEQELGDDFHVFASTRADAINSGDKWFDVIRERMDKADALVVLITESAKNSAWVGFELGYFWHKNSIYPLHHPRVSLPAPFSALQSKKITEREQLDNFFNALSEKLGVKRSHKADLDAIIKTAHEMVVIPVGDKSLGKFIEYLENSSWEVGDKTGKYFVCQDNIDYEIGITTRLSSDVFLEEGIDTYIVLLMIDKKEFRRLDFMIDTANILPAPSQINGQRIWLKDSLIMKVARAISKFKGYKPTTPEEFDRELEKIARFLDIEIIE